jgi:hypothetical protein
MPRAGQPTFSSPTTKRGTFRDATWHFVNRNFRQSAVLAALAVLIPIRCIRDSGAAMAAAYDAPKKAGFEQI